MEKKTSIWRKIFVLPAVPTLVIMAVAAALLVLTFRMGWYDARGAVFYMFSTYALILACTGYARLMERWPILKKIFTLPLIPSLIIIIIGAVLIIYVLSEDISGPLAYVANLVSSYALVLAITTYIRMFRELGQTDRKVSISGRRGDVAVKSKFLSGLISGVLAPFFDVVLVSFRYSMRKTAEGVAKQKAGTIVLAILSVIGILVMAAAGPLFFLIGITCIFWWTAHMIRGYVLCAIGLVLIVLSSQITLKMIEKQKAALAQGF